MAEHEKPENMKDEDLQSEQEEVEGVKDTPTGIKTVRKPYSCVPELSYKSQEHHERHVLDIYTPRDAPADKPLPTIIYIHGGAFKMGDKDTHVLPLRYLDIGYAVATINYRLSGHAPFPAAVQDCKAAVRWLRLHAKEYNLDDTKFVSMGDSAGAYMALMVAITGDLQNPLFDVGENLEVSSSVAGAVDYYGPTDFLQMDSHAPSHAFLKHDPEDSPESLFMGGHIVKIPEKVKIASPLTYIHDKTPPIFIGHGTQDSIVPFHQGQLMNEALKSAGRPITFHPVEGVDHVWGNINQQQIDDLFADTDKFLANLFGK